MNAALPEGLDSFLGDTRWDGAEIVPLVGDASFRRYFRLRMGDRSAMLMHAPPPEEDTGPFLHVARWLSENGMRGPEILGARPEQGLVLIEDFGDQRMKEWIDDHPEDEEAIYAGAIDALAALQALPPVQKVCPRPLVLRMERRMPRHRSVSRPGFSGPS